MKSALADRLDRHAASSRQPPPPGATPSAVTPLVDGGIWRNRSFLLLWLAQAVSQTAQNAIWYGIFVFVQQRSHSSTQMSLAVLALTVPSVLFGLVAGVYVDRWDKRLVLVATNLLRGLITLSYALLGAVAAIPLAALYVVNFAFQTVGQFFAPAEAAVIPQVVGPRHLLQANSLFHLTFTASQLAGLVLLGPLLVKLVGLQGLFLGMAVSLVLCAALVWPLPSHPAVARDEQRAPSGGAAVAHFREEVRAVGAFVLRDRLITLAMLQWTIGAILGLVVATLLPGFADRALRVQPEDAVFVMAPAGVGMLLGTAALNRWSGLFDKQFVANVGLGLVAACLTLMGALALAVEAVTASAPPLMALPVLGEVSALVPVVMAISLFAGLGFVAIIVPAQTYLQERAPVELRGRVFGVLFTLNNLANIPPLLLLGGLADLIGVDRTLILIGLLIGGAAVGSTRAAPGTPPWRRQPAEAGA